MARYIFQHGTEVIVPEDEHRKVKEMATVELIDLTLSLAEELGGVLAQSSAVLVELAYRAETIALQKEAE